MKSFLGFLLESKHKFSKTVALVGGSYKPPHCGHLDMVMKYADMADEVKVIISDPKSEKSIRKTSNGTVITPEMSKKIWDIYIKKYGLKNVTAEVSTEPSPITALYKYVDDNLSDVNVIFGVSKKGNDAARFKTALKYYADNEHINLIDPETTAVDPYVSSGQPVSATDIRNNINDALTLKKMLPKKLSNSDIKQIQKILEVPHALKSESDQNDPYEPLDETEAVNVQVTDDVLQNSKIAAYNVGQVLPDPEKAGKEVPVNPKKFPTKAVDVIFPVGELLVEVFLDTKTKKWDSDVIYKDEHVKLSPDQMGHFFKSAFYAKLLKKLEKSWPLSDKLYGELFEGIANKEMVVGPVEPIDEASNDKEMSNKDVNGDKQRDYTASGRRIVSFSDTQVSKKEAKFYCWPDEKHAFRWTQWKDWKKIKPLCRLRLKHGEHMYGMSLSTLGEDYDVRGFRGYDLTQQPPVQWLSKEENYSFVNLSLVQKFMRHCVEKITKYVSMDPEEVYKKIDAPDKITVKEIAKTQSCIRKTMNEVIKNKRIDSFKWR